jgi:hypothetical protein
LLCVAEGEVAGVGDAGALGVSSDCGLTKELPAGPATTASWVALRLSTCGQDRK